MPGLKKSTLCQADKTRSEPLLKCLLGSFELLDWFTLNFELNNLQVQTTPHSDLAARILPDSVIINVVEHISPEDLETIAIQYMGIKHPEIQTLQESERENINMLKFRIVEIWRNRNPVSDVNWRLYRILTGSGRVSTEACRPIIEQSEYLYRKWVCLN